MNRSFSAAGFELIGDGIKAPWNPDDESLRAAREYGKKFAAAL